MPNYQPQLKGLGRVLAGSRSMPVGGFFSYRDYPSLHRPGPPLMFYMCEAIYSHQSSVVHSEQQIGQALKDTLPTVQRQSSLPQLQHLGVQASGSFPSMKPLIAGVLLRVSFHMSRRLVPSQCPLVHRRTSYSLRHSTRPPALGGNQSPTHRCLASRPYPRSPPLERAWREIASMLARELVVSDVHD